MATSLTEAQKASLVDLLNSFYATKDEAKLGEIFDLFDLDHNKKIDANELKLVMSELSGQPVSDEDTAATITLADKNGDGVIDLQEFIEILKSS
jgi:calmodulin